LVFLGERAHAHVRIDFWDMGQKPLCQDAVGRDQEIQVAVTIGIKRGPVPDTRGSVTGHRPRVLSYRAGRVMRP